MISCGSHHDAVCARATRALLPSAGCRAVSASCQGRSREAAASAAMLQGTCPSAPAATGLPSKSPSAPLPPSLSSYAKQLISPITSLAPSLIVHQ